MKRVYSHRQAANFQEVTKRRAQAAVFGRLLAQHGQRFAVALPQQPLKNYPAVPQLGALVAGDVVGIDPLEQRIISCLPRKNLLQRQTPHGNLKSIAANISQLLIVSAVCPAPQFLLIERYQWAAGLLQLPAQLLLNKSDLLPDATQETADFWAHWDGEFPKRPWLLSCSRSESTAWSRLEAALVGEVSVLVGLSGVGKSSIIQKLIPDMRIRIGELSALSGEGQHTTRTATWYDLPWPESAIIDLPGVRDFLPFPRSNLGLAQVYPEIFFAARHCRFRDCAHQPNSLGCAVLQAVADGEILPGRLKRYQELQQQAQLPV
jgi:ribosome biogenesis GTPase